MTPERWQKIEQLCNAALEHETSQRETFLAQACRGDDELRREVQSLLAQEKPAEGFLESLGAEVAPEVWANVQDGSGGQSMIGRQLGSYDVISLLGVGGMGEVYQAHDSKLGRDVAIKVLPEAFAQDAERLTRFQREAKLLASLNHPNIATIHGLEQYDGVHYLVMELVAGHTLAERISGGPQAVEETLRISGQMAEALEAAHEKGVIHRDLKPANVKVTPEGRVKVLDFGLAKAFAGDSGLDLSNSPTLTAMGTEEGRILGTPAYMSPEQARGKDMDKRTDIWAFGCVLYEMLTGKEAFRAETVSDTIASVLGREPDWPALPPATPTKIWELLRRCLQKDSRHRLRDIGDARIEIQEVLAATATETKGAAVPEALASWRRVTALGLAGMALVAVGSIATWRLKPSSMPPQRIARFVITLPLGDQIGTPELALSPDGSHLAYVTVRGGKQHLFLRAMDNLEPKPVPDTGIGIITTPFFSPDSQWLGFFAGGKLMKVSVNGGAALTLAGGLPSPEGAAWSSRGTIVFGTDAYEPLQEIPDTGGTPHSLMGLDKGEVSHRWPEFLPGDGVLFIALQAVGRGSTIAAQSLGTGKHRDLLQTGFRPRYASSGHLIYAQAGNLVAVPFDARRLEVSGAAVPVVEGVLQPTGSGAAAYSFSSTGTLAYVSGTETAQTKAVLVSRNGTEQPLAVPARDYGNPKFSPDGQRIAFTITEAEDQIWVYDVAKESLSKFTFEGANNRPLWTPDGKQIAFTSSLKSRGSIFWQRADGSNGLEQLTTSESVHFPVSFSPDGQFLAFVELNPTTLRDIWVLRLSDRKLQPFLRTRFNETVPRFSPDGHWLAYMSDESGRYEIYAQPFPGPGGKYQISTEGGADPVWNPNGRELFYRSGDKMMAADVMTQPSFSTGKPRILFEGQYLPGDVIPSYDISPDGQRFLMLKPSELVQAAPTQINVVLNWFEDLKRRVPAKQ
jgi:Tol biopolymer transport system component